MFQSLVERYMEFLAQGVHSTARTVGDVAEFQHQYLVDAPLEGFFTQVRGMFTRGA
ncbi:hypothetical protein D3C86_2115510 [compost metagenome]